MKGLPQRGRDDAAEVAIVRLEETKNVVAREHVMPQSIRKLDNYRILTTPGEGEVGRVEEVYFDDEQWVVRYLVVKTGRWLRRRSVLISPYAVHSIDWAHRTIFVNLTRDQVEGSPGIDTDKPVSRQQEAEYHRYYGYPEYWQTATFWAWGAMPVIALPDPRRREEEAARRRAAARRTGADAHLRSSQVVLGYRIEASDDVIGHVADFLFDERPGQFVTFSSIRATGCMANTCWYPQPGFARSTGPREPSAWRSRGRKSNAAQSMTLRIRPLRSTKERCLELICDSGPYAAGPASVASGHTDIGDC
jgi:sporulation protein YlmC with PRC-barrel domain